MRIRSDSVIEHPLDRVYRAYRDEMPLIAEYIPEVSAIVERARDERDGGVFVHSEWISSTKLPPLVNRVIKPEHLRWDDLAEWDDAGHHVDWRIRMGAFTEQVQCGGRNRFVALGEGRTRVVIDGELKIEIRKIPGVPRVMTRKLMPRLESFFVRMISTNLQKVTGCLQTYLDEHKE
ncbi:MAG: hypothetical protein ACI9MC_000340 [Kiritimatiellia bacterium]|jgi:hypothetical protein